jgi:hypothetical protein
MPNPHGKKPTKSSKMSPVHWDCLKTRDRVARMAPMLATAAESRECTIHIRLSALFHQASFQEWETNQSSCAGALKDRSQVVRPFEKPSRSHGMIAASLVWVSVVLGILKMRPIPLRRTGSLTARNMSSFMKEMVRCASMEPVSRIIPAGFCPPRKPKGHFVGMAEDAIAAARPRMLVSGVWFVGIGLMAEADVSLFSIEASVFAVSVDAFVKTDTMSEDPLFLRVLSERAYDF